MTNVRCEVAIDVAPDYQEPFWPTTFDFLPRAGDTVISVCGKEERTVISVTFSEQRKTLEYPSGDTFEAKIPVAIVNLGSEVCRETDHCKLSKNDATEMFHRLWTMVAHSKDYDKEQWKQVRDQLAAAGIISY